MGFAILWASDSSLQTVSIREIRGEKLPARFGSAPSATLRDHLPACAVFRLSHKKMQLYAL